MKIRTLATSSSDGRALNNGSILDFSGKIAGMIAADKKNFREILSEPYSETLDRAENNLESNHHGIFGHQCVTLLIEDAPKILTMVLSSAGLFNVSENLSSFTEVKTSGLEEELYRKWQAIFYSDVVPKAFLNRSDEELKVLSLFYAQYLISIFASSTNLAYTTSVKRLNYIIGWMEDYIANSQALTLFEKRLIAVFVEFIREFDKNYIIPGLTDPNNREFSLFGTRERATEWGENYSYSYNGSFLQLAQAQIHRKIHYEFRFISPSEPICNRATFYVPEIIRDSEHEEEWLNDATLLMREYPQGMMVRINERGTLEDFALKCSKTLDLSDIYTDELISQTAASLNQYYWGTKEKPVRDYLAPLINEKKHFKTL